MSQKIYYYDTSSSNEDELSN